MACKHPLATAVYVTYSPVWCIRSGEEEMQGEGMPSVAAAVVTGQLRPLQQQLAAFAAV